jgi:cell wall-associated NlpC family hydrolase
MIEELDIRKYLEVPYKHQGRDLEGWDCYGLIKYAYAERGYVLFDMKNYDKHWSFRGRNLLLENYQLQWRRVEVPEYLDGIMFKNERGEVDHGGLVLKDNWFIHCCRVGTIRSRYDFPEWSKKIEGFYHLKARNDNY